MIKVAGMSLCSTAVITEERRAREGRGGREEREKGVGQLDSSSTTVPPSGVEVQNDFLILVFELSDLAEVHGI